MRKYIKQFFVEEDGSEMLQQAIIIVVVVGLIAVLFALKDKIGGKVEDTTDYVDKNLQIPKEKNPAPSGD